MKLKIKRYKSSTYCIGKLTINDEYFCDTLEDTDRGLTSSMTKKEIENIKKRGITAIPTGTYNITLNVVSPRFSKSKQYQDIDGKLPRLLNVTGFEGILIHIGNKPEDTDGCILVGFNKIKGQVINSTDTFKRLYKILKEAFDKGEELNITIE